MSEVHPLAGQLKSITQERDEVLAEVSSAKLELDDASRKLQIAIDSKAESLKEKYILDAQNEERTKAIAEMVPAVSEELTLLENKKLTLSGEIEEQKRNLSFLTDLVVIVEQLKGSVDSTQKALDNNLETTTRIYSALELSVRRFDSKMERLANTFDETINKTVDQYENKYKSLMKKEEALNRRARLVAIKETSIKS